MQIVAKKVLADDKVELKTMQEYDPALTKENPQMPKFLIQPMMKIDGAWKISGSTRGYQEEWDKDGRVEIFVP